MNVIHPTTIFNTDSLGSILVLRRVVSADHSGGCVLHDNGDFFTSVFKDKNRSLNVLEMSALVYIQKQQ